jgi:predicted Zn finger-like uncharacterized protein
MKIVCPTCTTSYDVGPAALGDNGRSVRCVRCRTVWFATPVEEPAVVEEPVLETAAEGDVASADTSQGGADEAAPDSEFDWSFSVADDPEPPKPAGDEAAAGEDGATQADVDAAWTDADAEAVVETAGPSLVPAMEADAASEIIAQRDVVAAPESIESVAARRAPKAKNRRKLVIPWPRLGIPAVIVALAAILVALAGFRGQIVRFAPQTASLYAAVGLPVNLRGLLFENVRTTGEVHEGVPVLIVEGTIANVVNRTVEVPRLRFGMRNAAGHEIYAWTTVTGRSILAPGETATFRSRLASPPPDGRDVIVRFITRRDLIAGAR